MVVISPSGWGQARLLSSEGIGFFFSRKIILNFTLNFDEKKINLPMGWQSKNNLALMSPCLSSEFEELNYHDA